MLCKTRKAGLKRWIDAARKASLYRVILCCLQMFLKKLDYALGFCRKKKNQRRLR
jgi:hypothetical protein